MKIFTKAFAIDTAERAINTFAQTLLALLAVGGAGVAAGFESVEWGGMLSVAGVAALISILKNVSVATKKPEPLPEVIVPDDNLDARHRATPVG